MKKIVFITLICFLGFKQASLAQTTEKPVKPSQEQIAQLEAAGQLRLLTSPEWIKKGPDNTVRKIELPRQGVSLLKFSW